MYRYGSRTNLAIAFLSSAVEFSKAQIFFQVSDLYGAGEGNRTLVSSLGSYSSTIELRPRSKWNSTGARGGKSSPWTADTPVRYFTGGWINLCTDHVPVMLRGAAVRVAMLVPGETGRPSSMP